MRRNRQLERLTTILGGGVGVALRARLGCAFPGCLRGAHMRVGPWRGTVRYWCDVHAEWGWTTRVPVEGDPDSPGQRRRP